MTEKPRESFETYPYLEPDPPLLEDGAQPAPIRPPAVLPPPVRPVGGPNRTNLSRRNLVIGGVGVGLAGLFGYSLFRRPEGDAVADPQEPADDATDIGDTGPTSAALETSYMSVSFDVPAGWTVAPEGDYLKVGNDGAALAAREPERTGSGKDDLSREADYLNEGFDPGGQPAVFADESDTRFTVLNRTRSGRFGGEPAAEHATLLVDGDSGNALVVWWCAITVKPEVAAEVRAMIRELRRGFEDS